ncbi:MAG: KEOPS complex subunit Pcc1 [Candidatus Thorarchaeota archaeon]
MSDLTIEDAEATMTLDMGSPESARLILTALNPETNSSPAERAKVRLSAEDSNLVIAISASDITALRAAMNSYLAWVSSCSRILEDATGQKS